MLSIFLDCSPQSLRFGFEKESDFLGEVGILIMIIIMMIMMIMMLIKIL
jgi:hypothetical protein